MFVSAVPDQTMAASGNTAIQSRKAPRISNGSRQKALSPRYHCEDEHASVTGGFDFDFTRKESADKSAPQAQICLMTTS